jgi:hypothetical protein
MRGTTLFVHGDIAAGGLGVMDDLGPSVGQFDLDALDIQAMARSIILLSAEKPSGHARQLGAARSARTQHRAASGLL